MKALALSTLLMTAVLFAMDLYSKDSSAAQLAAKSIVPQPLTETDTQRIKHGAKLINLGFSGTTL